jgi:hypothetical protein
MVVEFCMRNTSGMIWVGGTGMGARGGARWGGGALPTLKDSYRSKSRWKTKLKKSETTKEAYTCAASYRKNMNYQ